jgi:hypothetical protein
MYAKTVPHFKEAALPMKKMMNYLQNITDRKQLKLVYNIPTQQNSTVSMLEESVKLSTNT